jgi:hypothetical protein
VKEIRTELDLPTHEDSSTVLCRNVRCQLCSEVVQLTFNCYVGIVLRDYWKQQGKGRLNCIMGKWVVRMGGGWNWLRIVCSGRLWY